MFKRGVYAGTFGPLHEGHKKIIDTAMGMVDYLFVGVTIEEISNKKIRGTGQKMQTYLQRAYAIDDYMKIKGMKFDDYDIIPVGDGILQGVEFGGEYMFISDEQSVIDRALHINTLRRTKGYDELILVIVPRVRSDDGTVISSTDIRKKAMIE